jgi:hypothetical protein
MHRMLRFCSAYCNRSASPITGREAIRVRSHGSRNGTGRSCFRACRGAGTNPEVEAVMLGPSSKRSITTPRPESTSARTCLGPEARPPSLPVSALNATIHRSVVYKPVRRECVRFGWSPYHVSARKSAAIRAR